MSELLPVFVDSPGPFPGKYTLNEINSNRKKENSMSEEKVVETTEEEITLGEDSLETDESQDASSESEDDVEGSDGQEAEVDERGVPYKNKVAELERKLNASSERESTYRELLKELKSNKSEASVEQIQELIESVTDDEFASESIAASTASLIRKAARVEAKRALAEREAQINQEAKGLQAKRAEFEATRQASLREVKDELSGEFGELFKENGDWNTNSEIYKRTCEIFNNSPSLRNRADGQATAARKAELELTKAKYGKTKPPKRTDKSEVMKGGGTKRGGGGGSIKNSSGQFHRELTDSEFDKLDREDQSKYLAVERTFIKK